MLVMAPGCEAGWEHEEHGMTDTRPSGREHQDDQGRAAGPSTTSPDRTDQADDRDARSQPDGAGRRNDEDDGILEKLLREGPDAPDAADIEDPDHHL
jgi:hypothetical protein